MNCLIRHYKRRRRQRAVTLIEILIVVAIMAMISGAVGVMVMHHHRDAQQKVATMDASAIRRAASLWRQLGGHADCPTVESLRAAGQLDRAGNEHDPWGNPYQVSCDGTDIVVSSAGADRAHDTDDDVLVGHER